MALDGLNRNLDDFALLTNRAESAQGPAFQNKTPRCAISVPVSTYYYTSHYIFQYVTKIIGHGIKIDLSVASVIINKGASDES